MSEREQINREIFKLLNEINIHALCGCAEDVNRLRDQIAGLERKKQNLNEKRNEP
jgi:hypothetical protein